MATQSSLGTYAPIQNTATSNFDLVQTAYEKLAYFALRPELYYDAVAEVKATDLTNPGATIKFTIFNDLAAASTALSETVDITPVTLDDSQITVSLLEYGNAVQTSARLRSVAFMQVNPIIANVLGFNAGISIDSVARNTAQQGTGYAFPTLGVSKDAAWVGAVDATGSQVRTNLGTGNTITPAQVLRQVAALRGANVPTFNGLYKSFIHPDVSYDLRQVTGTTGWADPHAYSDPSGIWNGVIGVFGGAQFMETPRAPLFANAGGNGAAAATGATATTSISSITSTTSGNVTTVTATTAASHTIAVGGYFSVAGNLVSGNSALNGDFVAKAGTDSTTSTLVFDLLPGQTLSSNTVTGSAGVKVIKASVNDVYGTLIMGRQALAKGFSVGGGYGEQPVMVDVPVTDALRRFEGMGWKHLVGYSVFRQAALRRIETVSSIGNNAS